MQKRIKHPLLFPITIGLFGALGASIRSLLTNVFAFYEFFPVGTWIINTTGSFLLSVLFFHPKIRKKIDPLLFTAITVGMIGSFTTFSAVTVDTIQLMSSRYGLAAFYMIGNIITSIIACFIGYAVTKGR